MRLLLLAPALPDPRAGGGGLRMWHLLHFLAARFEVDLLAPRSEAETATRRTLESLCREVELVPPARTGWRRRVRLGPYERDPALAAAVRRRLASGRYGAVQVEKPAMLPYVSSSPVPVVLDCWAYGLSGPVRALRRERGLDRRLRNLVRLVRFAAFDRWRWPPTHAVLLVSEDDRRRAARDGRPGRLLVVPNGVDVEHFAPGPATGTGETLLFTGDMSFAPNVEAAVVLAREILPALKARRPAVRLRLVGREPAPAVRALAGPDVVVTGPVDDMAPELRAATVYVAPLWTGAGTRTKLLEAMACGLAVVTTPTGIEGIEATDGREVVVCSEPADFVGAVARLLDEPDERRRLGAAARTLAVARYDWRRCLEPLVDLYRPLLAPIGAGVAR